MTADLERTEQELQRQVASANGFVTEIAAHLISAGGKRLRPGFAMASAAVEDDSPRPASQEAILGGCAVELVHIGSLYHDDVMDGAESRRSVKSVNARWGNLRAILAGDYLLGRASEIAASLGAEVAGILAATITQLCEGQIQELQSAYDTQRSIENYEQSIGGKTAALLATACRIGAIVGGVRRPVVESLTEFGQSYGMAFQVVDDILDLVSDEQDAGKPVGNDLLEGTYTLPVILALEEAGVAERLSPLLTPEISDVQRDLARDLVRRSSGVRTAADVAQGYADKAAGALSSLPDTPAARALRAAGDDLMARVGLYLD